jgi:hypothetical protein
VVIFSFPDIIKNRLNEVGGLIKKFNKIFRLEENLKKNSSTITFLYALQLLAELTPGI